MTPIAHLSKDRPLLLVGGAGSHLGQSAYLRTIHARADGAPPPVDLAAEKRHGDFVRAAIAAAVGSSDGL